MPSTYWVNRSLKTIAGHVETIPWYFAYPDAPCMEYLPTFGSNLW